MTKKITQTAGRTQLGDFAPMFAHLNDDVLFGEVWNEAAIDVKTKCIITVVSLMASGITDSSLGYHLQNAKNNGGTKEEIAAIITHATMHLVFRSMASSFHTSPNSTSSFRWANIGAKSPSCVRPAVWVIFLVIVIPPIL